MLSLVNNQNEHTPNAEKHGTKNYEQIYKGIVHITLGFVFGVLVSILTFLTTKSLFRTGPSFPYVSIVTR